MQVECPPCYAIIHGRSLTAVFNTKCNTMLSIILCMLCSTSMICGPMRMTCATRVCLLSAAVNLTSAARALLSACSTRRLTRGQRRRKGARTLVTATQRTMRADMHARAHGTQARSLPSPQPPLLMAAACLTQCRCMILTYL